MRGAGAALVAVSLAAASALLGAWAALAATLVHRQVLRMSGLTIPWGLLLGLVTIYVVIQALTLTVAGVRGAVGCAVGWVVTVLGLQSSRPEGDFLVSGDALGSGFVLGGMAVVAVAVIRSITSTGRPTVAGAPR